MKTLAVVLMAMLYVMPLSVKSNRVSFGTEVLVDQVFSEKELNVTVTRGSIVKGDTVLLERHPDYLRAMKDKYVITGNTTNQAHIVAFFGNEKISLEDAFALLNNYNIYEASVDNYKERTRGFHFSIEVLSTTTQNLNDYLKICPELDKMVAQKDENIFLVGYIPSFSKAMAIQEKLVAAGLKNNIIVAFDGNKQVPVYHLAKNK